MTHTQDIPTRRGLKSLVVFLWTIKAGKRRVLCKPTDYCIIQTLENLMINNYVCNA